MRRCGAGIAGAGADAVHGGEGAAGCWLGRASTSAGHPACQSLRRGRSSSAARQSVRMLKVEPPAILSLGFESSHRYDDCAARGGADHSYGHRMLVVIGNFAFGDDAIGIVDLYSITGLHVSHVGDL